MRKRLFSLLGWVAGGALGWLVLRGVDWGEAASAIEHVGWAAAIGAVAILGLAHWVKALRWKLLLPGETVSTSRLFLVRVTGAGVSNVSPIHLLGDSTEIVLLNQGDGISLPKLVASVFINHLFDIVVTANLVAVGLLTVPQLWGYWPMVVPLAAGSLVGTLAAPAIARRLLRVSRLRRNVLLRAVLSAVQTIQRRPRVTVACAGLTLAAWLMGGVAAWLVAHTMGLGLDFWPTAVLTVAVLRLGGIIPAPPGVVGVFEFMVVTGLGLFGVAPPAALSFAVVIHVLMYLPPIMVAAVMLVAERGTLATAAARLMQPVRQLRFGQQMP